MDIEQEQKEHPTRVISVFNVWECIDNNYNKPHYPSYPVHSRLVGSAFSLEAAERIIRNVINEPYQDFWNRKRHHLRIMEMPVGVHSESWDARSERIYDSHGKLIDERTEPQDSPYPGRTPDRIRFAPGDLCEVIGGVYDDKAVLGVVVKVPPTPEAVNSKQGFPVFDYSTDDYYLVLTGSHLEPFRAEALQVFPPKAKVPSGTERRLRKAFEDYKTLPMRQRIADTAALAKLRAILDALDLSDTEITLFDGYLQGSLFLLVIKGVKGFPEGLHLEIGSRLMQSHPNRVEATLKRLTGKKTDVKGYSLKKVDMPDSLPNQQVWYRL